MSIALNIIEKTGMKIKMKPKNNIAQLIILTCSIFFIGWGGLGHSIINFNTILSALPEMDFFEYWADSLANHASDADYRKQIDPDEGPRHYIDIDNYPEFLETGMINQNFDSLVAIHGYNFVMEQGILPWAILRRIDSLQIAFENAEWHNAMLHASDLGHYIADDHMPLHLTRNYNGQYTGQRGIHSRYESNMIGQFSNQIIYEGDTLNYIDNLSDYIFSIIYDNYNYVDSVLLADSIATEFAGNTTSAAYYEKLWELTKSFTIPLFKNASYKLTCLIYTAWVNAGSVVVPVELTSFTATSISDGVRLNWATATETNNSGFEVQRKLENTDWERIGFVEGHGTTTEKQTYQYTDQIDDVQSTSIKYRLKQIDFDGSYEYSDEVLVDVPLPLEFALHQNFPNPFNNSTVINYSISQEGIVSLTVYNIIGEEVTELVNDLKQTGNYKVSFDATSLPSGIYFYKLQAGSFIETKKMVLLK